MRCVKDLGQLVSFFSGLGSEVLLLVLGGEVGHCCCWR